MKERLDMMLVSRGLAASREKGKMKKNFRKYLEDILKSFYLCIRFPEKKADMKEAIFEEIYINNTSSTRARLVSQKKRNGLG